MKPVTVGMMPPVQICWQPAARLSCSSVSDVLSSPHGFSIAYWMIAMRTWIAPAAEKKTFGTISISPNPIGCSPVTGSSGNEPEQKYAKQTFIITAVPIATTMSSHLQGVHVAIAPTTADTVGMIVSRNMNQKALCASSRRKKMAMNSEASVMSALSRSRNGSEEM